MSASRLSWLMVALGVLMIIVPPIFFRDLENAMPVFLLAVVLIIYGLWRIIRARFFPKASPKVVVKAVNGTEARSLISEDQGDDPSAFTADDRDYIRVTHSPREGDTVHTGATVSPSRDPWKGSKTAMPLGSRIVGAGAAQAVAQSKSPHGQGDFIPPGDADEDRGLFDIDPELVKLEIIEKIKASLLELFDADPTAVRAAIAAMMQRELDNLFDTDPETLKHTVAEMLEQQILELFDIDPIVVRQAIAARSEQQLGELFDVDPEQVKKAVSELLQGVLFDIDPDEVRQVLAGFAEAEILQLFDIDPALVKAALKLRYATEMLELFDKDPAMLRATFAWRKDRLSELFDADPEALRALWEAQKAEPLNVEQASRRALAAMPVEDIAEILLQQQELVEMLSQISLGALRRRKAQREQSELPYEGKVSLEILRRQVAMRIVEDKILSLEIQRSAVRGVIAEARLSAAQKALLLNELSQKLTGARTLAKQLQQETKAQIAKQRLAEQDAAFRASRRPKGDLDPALQERMRQRMLERSMQAQKTTKE